ncbi:head assembly cochaperone with GroEL [Acinetobacter phage KARL-1]|uniref:Head assembly cochaperone with GroEL n=1 Tax=Acinetobacter phage KARL-1 TaxID=2301662 RepID=A0A385III4_9CAUD|nr:head morphogenesis [Acinetobacter phage KARL-1]AXY82692.1 head assembly cochaperone with GroEL [Acinetobacter phage KARL-1]
MAGQIVALGSNVILKAVAKSAGAAQKTASGIILPPKQESEIPNMCEIFAIGPTVPFGLVEIGDKTPFPLGEKLNVPHPDVVAGICEAKDRDDKYITTHFSNIACVYKNL